MSRYDDIVIGAGVNGLVAATRLGMGGRRVLLVDRAETPGGRCASHEFHPGFRSPGLLSDTSALRPVVLQELDLKRFGILRRAESSSCVTLCPDSGVLDPDATSSPWHAWIGEVAPVIESFVDDAPLDLLHPERAPLSELIQRGLELRRLGRKTMMQLLRVPPMAVADWLRESFDDEPTMAALALPALKGTWLAPRSPGSAFNLLFDRAIAGPPIRGGTPALVEGLVAAAEAASVEIRCGAAVDRLHLSGERVAGVRLEDGATVEAKRVAASNGPRQVMLQWLPPGRLPWRQRRRYEAYRCRGTTAQLLLALDGVPEVLDGVEYAQTATSLDAIERAFDAVKYRRFSNEPVLWLHQASLRAAGLAPDGGAVVAAMIQYAPHDLDGGWDDPAREALVSTAMRVLERHVPGIGARVVGSRLLTPTDIEQRYGLEGGQIHHGEHALDQWLVRPEPDAALYRTPVPGLWFCGGGSHPGGGLTGAPGRHAARAMLAD
jgi:phytoene dehydrogenase-like protein